MTGTFLLTDGLQLDHFVCFYLMVCSVGSGADSGSSHTEHTLTHTMDLILQVV